MPPATRFTLATGDVRLLRDRDDDFRADPERDDPLFRAELLREELPPDERLRFDALREVDDRLRDADDFRAAPPDEPLRFVALRDDPLFRAELPRFVVLRDDPPFRAEPPRADDFRAAPPDDPLREADFRAELPPARLPPLLLLDPDRPPPDALRERPDPLFRALPPLLPDRPLLRADLLRVDFDAVAISVCSPCGGCTRRCARFARTVVCAIGNAVRSVHRAANILPARRPTLPSIRKAAGACVERASGDERAGRRVTPHTTRGRMKGARCRILTCS